jgi:hypothetical protein
MSAFTVVIITSIIAIIVSFRVIIIIVVQSTRPLIVTIIVIPPSAIIISIVIVVSVIRVLVTERVREIHFIVQEVCGLPFLIVQVRAMSRVRPDFEVLFSG